MSTVSPNVPNGGVVELTAATLTLDPTVHAGITVVSNLAATQTITLPAATGTGHRYTVFVQTTKTGDLVIQAASASDTIGGTLAVSTDAAGVVVPTAATSDTITMNGSTTGGVKGSTVHLQDVATGVWMVTGGLVSTGVEATPFSAAV